MDALEAIRERHSTREYADRPVPRELLEQIVDAGRRATTARNDQPWEFLILTDATIRQRIAAMTEYGKFLAQAPVCIAVFCKEGRYYLEDGCNASENMLLAATALGVQSCWVAGDKKDYCGPIRALLGVPEGYKLISLLAMGYQARPAVRKQKRPLSEVLHWEQW